MGASVGPFVVYVSKGRGEEGTFIGVEGRGGGCRKWKGVRGRFRVSISVVVVLNCLGLCGTMGAPVLGMLLGDFDLDCIHACGVEVLNEAIAGASIISGVGGDVLDRSVVLIDSVLCESVWLTVDIAMWVLGCGTVRASVGSFLVSVECVGRRCRG